MTVTRQISGTAWAVLGIAAIMAGCADTPTSIVQEAPRFHVSPITQPGPEIALLCKVGPAGTYTFDAQATHPVLYNSATGANDLTSATYTVVVSAGSTIDAGGGPEQGACFSFTNANGVHNHFAVAGGNVDAQITVVETGIPAGVAFEQAVVYQNVGGTVTSATTTVNSATGRVGGNGTSASGLMGASFIFYNETVPVFFGNSINVQTVIVAPALAYGSVTSFTRSFQIKAFDQAVTVTALAFRISKNGESHFWQGSCTTTPGVPFNVGKSSTVTVAITPSCAVGAGPLFKKGDDVKLTVIATLATGRVFSNTGFYKIP